MFQTFFLLYTFHTSSLLHIDVAGWVVGWLQCDISWKNIDEIRYIPLLLDAVEREFQGKAKEGNENFSIIKMLKNTFEIWARFIGIAVMHCGYVWFIVFRLRIYMQKWWGRSWNSQRKFMWFWSSEVAALMLLLLERLNFEEIFSFSYLHISMKSLETARDCFHTHRTDIQGFLYLQLWVNSSTSHFLSIPFWRWEPTGVWLKTSYNWIFLFCILRSVLFTLHFRIHSILSLFFTQFWDSLQSSDELIPPSRLRFCCTPTDNGEQSQNATFLRFSFFMALDWPRLEMDSQFLLLLWFFHYLLVVKMFKREFFLSLEFIFIYFLLF